MKTLITTLLLTLFTLAAHGQSLIKNTVDEFTGNRIVQSEYVKIDQDGFDGNAYITAIYNAGDYAVVVLIQSRDSWQLLGTDYADFIIDGSRDRKTLHAVESDVKDGGVQESHAFLLSDAEYNEIAEAVNVRFRANRTIYTFNQKAIEALRIVRDEIELN